MPVFPVDSSEVLTSPPSTMVRPSLMATEAFSSRVVIISTLFWSIVTSPPTLSMMLDIHHHSEPFFDPVRSVTASSMPMSV